MAVFAKRGRAKAIRKAIPCRKVAMAVLGLEVPHAHIHLAPIDSEGDMDFRNKIENPDPARMAEIAAKNRFRIRVIPISWQNFSGHCKRCPGFVLYL